MTALADVLQRKLRSTKTISLKVKNAATIYPGALVAVDILEGSTSRGYALPYDGSAGQMLVGRALPTPDIHNLGNSYVTGNTSASPVPEVTVVCDESEIYEQASVTGATSIALVGSPVYASDDNVLTLTRPTRGTIVGKVIRVHSSGVADVLRYNAGVTDAIALGGNGVELINLGHVSLLGSVDGAVLKVTGIPGRFRLLSAYAVTAQTSAGGTTAVFTLSKGATALTAGGVISLGATDAVATQFNATAITQDAASEFSEGDEVRVTLEVTGTYTAGAVNIYAKIQRLPGA